jgi:hypothetical protein
VHDLARFQVELLVGRRVFPIEKFGRPVLPAVGAKFVIGHVSPANRWEYLQYAASISAYCEMGAGAMLVRAPTLVSKYPGIIPVRIPD